MLWFSELQLIGRGLMGGVIGGFAVFNIGNTDQLAFGIDSRVSEMDIAFTAVLLNGVFK